MSKLSDIEDKIDKIISFVESSNIKVRSELDELSTKIDSQRVEIAEIKLSMNKKSVSNKKIINSGDLKNASLAVVFFISLAVVIFKM